MVLIVGMTVLLGGWGLRSQVLIRIQPDFASMVPSTAICFLLVAATNLLHDTRPSGFARRAVAAAAVLVLVVAISDLVMLYGPGDVGLDRVLWPSVLEQPGDAMAAATATGFVLAAIASLGRLSNSHYSTLAVQACATLGFLLSSVAIVGYLLDASALYEVFPFTAMALHTALAFAFLFVGFLASRPDTGWVSVLAGEGRGSRGARRLIPIVLVGPLLLSVLVLLATDAGLFSPNFRLALLAIILMSLTALAVLRNAALENESEVKLKAAMARTEGLARDKELLLSEVYHRVKNNLQQIDALLKLESRKLQGSPAVEPFKAMSSRVRALSLVHQLLLQSGSQSQIELDDFLSRLCAEIAMGGGLEERRIAIKTEVPNISAPMDVGNTMGLLVNELVANSIKHAFPSEEGGTIAVAMELSDASHCQLVVADNGTSNPEFDPSQRSNGGSGSRIIRALTTQLGGTLRVEHEGGTRVIVRFPQESLKGNTYVRNEKSGDRR